MSAPPADDVVLVRRLADVIDSLIAEVFDPGTEALAAVFCARQWLVNANLSRPEIETAFRDAGFTALSTSPNGLGEAWRPGREEIARIISPSSWAFYDRHVSAPAMRAEVNHQVSFSLADADDILALQPRWNPKGHDRHWLEVPMSNGMQITIVREDDHDAVTIWNEAGDIFATGARPLPQPPALEGEP